MICDIVDNAKHAGLVGPGTFVPKHIFSARGWGEWKEKVDGSGERKWKWGQLLLKPLFKVGKVYLAGPPEGHKVALPGAAVSTSFQPNITFRINLLKEISLFLHSFVGWVPKFKQGRFGTWVLGTLLCMILLRQVVLRVALIMCDS